MVSSSHQPPVKHSPLSHCLLRPHGPTSPPNLSSLTKTTLPLSTTFNIYRSPNTIHNPSHPNFSSNPQPPSLKNQIPSSSPANKPACKFYMQGRCKNGRKGTNCSFPHPNMCFRFIALYEVVIKVATKGPANMHTQSCVRHL